MPASHRRQFRPEWIPTLALIAVLALTVSAGRWQLQRAADKVVLQGVIDAAASAVPVPVQSLGASAALEALAWRPIEAVGRFDAERVVLLDNRTREGVAGYEVLTPFVLSGSADVLLVNRGWIAAPARRDRLPQIATPDGEVRLIGLATVPSTRFIELRAQTDDTSRWQNWTIDRARARWGLDLLAFAMLQTGETRPVGVVSASAAQGAQAAVVPADGLMRIWPRPDAGIDKHRGYALQWFSFASIALVVWIALAMRRPAEPAAAEGADLIAAADAPADAEPIAPNTAQRDRADVARAS
ncbi:MAG: SURF1 family protein [Proteobacteria bacterium]|nr:SURF1 family protein [Burkholderiales bacterium]